MSQKRVAIYTRVSTDDQTTANQDIALQIPANIYDWKITKTYADDGVSGSISPWKRPQMRKLIEAVHNGKVDMVAIYELSRLGRKTLDVLNLANELRRYGVDLYIHTLNIDTSTPTGEAIFGIMASLAQMERAQIIERTRAGLQRARIHGTKSGKAIGRPTTVTPDIQNQVHLLRQQGKGINTIAKHLAIGSGTVRKLLLAEAYKDDRKAAGN